MAFKMKGFSGFTKKTDKGTKGILKGIAASMKRNPKLAKEAQEKLDRKKKYQKAVKEGTVKPDYFNNFMYKVTGNIKYKIRK